MALTSPYNLDFFYECRKCLNLHYRPLLVSSSIELGLETVNERKKMEKEVNFIHIDRQTHMRGCVNLLHFVNSDKQVNSWHFDDVKRGMNVNSVLLKPNFYSSFLFFSRHKFANWISWTTSQKDNEVTSTIQTFKNKQKQQQNKKQH